MKNHIVCQIQDLTHEGLGVGKTLDKVVFVEGALPGEEVEVSLKEEKDRYFIGGIKKIIHPSPFRVEPKCPVFSECGGCQIMHLKYEEQLFSKKKRVESQLQRIGGFKDFEALPIEGCENPFWYRNKVELHFDKTLGFYRKHSHNIIKIKECFIAKGLLNKLITFFNENISDLKNIFRITLRCNQDESEGLVLFHFSKPGNLKQLVEKLQKMFPQVVGILEIVKGGQKKLLFGGSSLKVNVLGALFDVDALAFLQINLPQAEKLYSTILDLLKVKEGSSILDAYCGIGILSCLMAKMNATVVGVESSPEAIHSAKQNALNLGIKKASFFVSKLEEMTFKDQHFDSVVINPPRKGCDPVALKKIIALSPKSIVYVSCDPATLARDLKLLAASGYRLKSAKPFDLFPHTMHVETVAFIEKQV